jgi:hypothetical protein
LAAAASAIFYLLCLKLGFGRERAIFGWALFSFSAPWLEHSQIVLAEMEAGLVLLLALASWRGVLPRAWAFAAYAFLPWLHVRFFPLAAFLPLMDAWGRRREGAASWLRPLAWAGLSLGAAFLFNYLEYGSASVAKTYEQRQQGWEVIIKLPMMLRYACGLMIDQEYGWLPYAPVFAVSFFGLGFLFLKDRSLFWQTCLPALIYLVPLASFPWWFSGMEPNRYVVPLTPHFALWALAAWRAWGARPWFTALAWLSWGWGLALSVLPWFSWGHYGVHGENWILKILGAALHADLPRYFPSFMIEDLKSYFWAAGLALLGLWAARRLGPSKIPKDEAFPV